MSFLKIEETIIFDDKDELLSAHLYLQLKKRGIHISPKDLALIVELYNQGGYSTKFEQDRFFDSCLSKKFKKTTQSIRNTLNKFTKIKVLSKDKNYERYINKDFLPTLNDSKMGFIYKMTHK